jgi:gamma-glutamylcyclotransferase (GGCT)/AIG2-like uncharacterized protein YtfP
MSNSSGLARWWDSSDLNYRDLVAGLDHLREAKRESERRNPMGEYEAYVRATIRFARGFHGGQDDQGEGSRIRRYVRAILSQDQFEPLLKSEATRALVGLRPPIFDEKIARELRALMGRFDLTEAELEKARKAHRALIEAYRFYFQNPSQDARCGLSKQLGQLFWLIRCNLDHGEKTPYGLDLEKAERDRTVLERAMPVISGFLNCALDLPSHRLVVYGTLRSDGQYHDRIADLGNRRWVAKITGRLDDVDGHAVLVPLAAGDVDVEVYESNLLTPDYWDRLDTFEGQLMYRREFIPVRLADGKHIIGTAYVNARI